MKGLAAAVLLIVGVILLFATVHLSRLSAQSSAEPEQATLETVISRGTTGNANVLLTDFAVCQDYVEASRDRIIAESDQGGWYPVVPAAPDAIGWPDCSEPVRAVIATTRGADVARAYLRAPMRVIVGSSSLSGDVLTELKKVSPQTTDWDSVVVIQDGALPGSGGRLGALVASVLCLLGGGALGWSALRSRREE